MPKTKLGVWSVGLIAGFFILLMIAQVNVAIGQSQGAFEDTTLNIFQIMMPLTIIPAGICGIFSFLTGAVSIIKSKERSILVLIASVVGLFDILFVLGELLVPH